MECDFWSGSLDCHVSFLNIQVNPVVVNNVEFKCRCNLDVQCTLCYKGRRLNSKAGTGADGKISPNKFKMWKVWNHNNQYFVAEMPTIISFEVFTALFTWSATSSALLINSSCFIPCCILHTIRADWSFLGHVLSKRNRKYQNMSTVRCYLANILPLKKMYILKSYFKKAKLLTNIHLENLKRYCLDSHLFLYLQRNTEIFFRK